MSDWIVLAYSVGHYASDEPGIAGHVLEEMIGTDLVKAMIDDGTVVGGNGLANQYPYDSISIYAADAESTCLGHLRVYSDGGVEISDRNEATMLSDAAKKRGWL